MPTSTAEDYLKIILQKTETSKALVPMGEIAEGVGVAPGTVTTMVKSLAEQALIEHHPRQGVKLTEAGKQAAMNVLRRHRLVEAFLVTILKMDWAEVHVEAERLEHALSDRVLERLDALLGHPKFDPHGDPIPSAQGRMEVREETLLSSCERGFEGRLVRVADQSSDFLQFAEREGLVPGALLRLRQISASAGTLTVERKDGRSLTLGLAQAGKLGLVVEAWQDLAPDTPKDHAGEAREEGA